MVYRWKSGSHLKGDAQLIGEHLEHLRIEHGGLTSRIVVDDAKPESSPTHTQFDWNDADAADRWRLFQAGHILSCILVRSEDDARLSEPTRAFVVVKEDEVQHYTSIHVALADDELMGQILARALRELEIFEKKYSALSELAGVIKAIRRVTKRLSRP